MEVFGLDVLENVGRYLALEDRLNLAMTSKACFSGLQRKLDFVNAAVERPSVLRVKHQNTAVPDESTRWLVSGNGRVLVSIEIYLRLCGELCITRMSIPELESQRIYLRDQCLDTRLGETRLSHSGKLLAFDFFNDRGGMTHNVHIAQLGEGGVVMLGSYMFVGRTIWEIRISPSDQYIAVGMDQGMFVMDREARILYSCPCTFPSDFLVSLGNFAFTEGDDLLFLSEEPDGVEVGGKTAVAKMCSPPFTDQVRLAPLPERVGGRWGISLQEYNRLVYHQEEKGLVEAFTVLPRAQGYQSYLTVSKKIPRYCTVKLVSYVEDDERITWVCADGSDRRTPKERVFVSNNGHAPSQSATDRKSWTIGSLFDRRVRTWESSSCIQSDGGWCSSAYSSRERDDTIVCVMNLRPFLESKESWELVMRAACA
ncbi:hypothetical protein NDN08_000822 [Rhodosorus marinus]|uniref:F-box domain-containing protein n=1 Tax=Rhodosorus marinus TaxID=101924 RepID=A0AAV8UUR9_9RHOD|nr:hypothetical protein NDN08_000822 [Rhodosorus marinus]